MERSHPPRVARTTVPTGNTQDQLGVAAAVEAVAERIVRLEAEFVEEYMADLGARSPYRQC